MSQSSRHCWARDGSYGVSTTSGPPPGSASATEVVAALRSNAWPGLVGVASGGTCAAARNSKL
ncbi:hypothetical protein ACN28G_08990 [Micromonospora sp. WMMA1923]|uniref:hypothetical protein n=1 Tax=Micromonospora sp. WMMA1923 TaxID=3404125 RepID=UPI003B95900B